MRIIKVLHRLILTQYKLFILSIQVFVLCENSVAGFEQSLTVTPVFLKAYSGIAVSSFDRIVVNPASGTGISSFCSSVWYTPAPFQMTQLSQCGFMAGYPFSFGTVAAGVQTTGFSLYRETLGMLTWSGQVTDGIACGLSSRLYHLSIAQYGTAFVAGIDIGAVAQVSEFVSVGISIMNLNGADIGSDDDIPRSIGAGISIRPVSELTVCADIVKDLRYEESIRIALEFSPFEMFMLSAGIQSEPARVFGGISVTATPITFHYGVGTHADLGLSHSIGISYNL